VDLIKLIISVQIFPLSSMKILGINIYKKQRNRLTDDDWEGLAYLCLVICAGMLILFLLLVSLILAILVGSFLLGSLIAHLFKNSGILSRSKRPWIGRMLFFGGIVAIVYLKIRGGLGPAWWNWIDAISEDDGTIWNPYFSIVLLNLSMWSAVIGTVCAVPMHWILCEDHHLCDLLESK
tara:strand:+ start:611 stop:1147 length:537 start_codon:yes stop_codon:yes gene_type:complete